MPLVPVTTTTPNSTSCSSAHPETLNHLLSLPPLLQPLSPSLAALHLARVRLLLSLPASPFNGQIGEWWCHACGGLREGVRGGLKRKNGSGEGVDRRKKAECSTCGASYRRANPDRRIVLSFSPARTRAKRSATKASTSTLDSIAVGDANLDSSSASIEAALTEETPLKPRPTLLSTPSLTYIPSSAPNVPTYPQPIGRAVASLPSSAYTSQGGKRRKKSGLAKLLAENKERVEKDSLTGGGSWGLG